LGQTIFFAARVGSATSGSEKFHPIIPPFSIFFLWVKKITKNNGLKAGQPLIYFGSKECSGRVRAHLYWEPQPVAQWYFNYKALTFKKENQE